MLGGISGIGLVGGDLHRHPSASSSCPCPEKIAEEPAQTRQLQRVLPEPGGRIRHQVAHGPNHSGSFVPGTGQTDRTS